MEVVGEGKRPESPPARTVPFAQPRADDRALGVVLRDRRVFSGVVELAVDLVRQHDDAIAPGNLGELA